MMRPSVRPMVGALLVAFALLFAADAASAATTDVGFRRMRLADQPGRMLEATVWYPAAAPGPATLMGDNAAFVGVPVMVDALPAAGRHRLVVLSHGYGGHVGNQGWLAAALVQRGYVVAAVNHPGTTSRNRNPEIGAQLWERPHDLSRLIDHVTRDPALGVDADKVGIIGHSLGGWTALAMAGARTDPARLEADCAVNTTLGACEAYHELGAGQTPNARARLAGDLRDPRIGAAVALDLGMARGFTPDTLAAIRIPVLVISAGEGDDRIPAKLESGYLVEHLPASGVTYLALDGAAHFSFLPLCKSGAAALLEADTPGDGMVCRDGTPAADRATLHGRTAEEVGRFLDASLGPP
ncbi:alpha/beta hydrolase [Ancylobacter dichloromethanicus]|uniref:Serine aminopeptidase S33 domain-containing protein n=1 Tax=Ancylobacter dichloromethanicus TaxID=518825 RepID=A0A9W6J8E2_9HYPH|nr:alpha/beta fold hydrolase [Ancylobacter dichloromethanicus]MBS7554483.1 alpha/beta hydrolase [Ancylobacter dichloromethanicus]GLK71613.1 hypothetical protein GCM10017643_17280 [Ancylobacter dichloromethanicus]